MSSKIYVVGKSRNIYNKRTYIGTVVCGVGCRGKGTGYGTVGTEIEMLDINWKERRLVASVFEIRETKPLKEILVKLRLTFMT